MKNTITRTIDIDNGGVAAVYTFPSLGENGVKKSTSFEIPMPIYADNLKKRRTEAGLSYRKLAEKCRPAIDHTTIARVEKGLGFTNDTLERLAVALNCQVEDFFLPPELDGWYTLSSETKERLGSIIQDAITAEKFRNAGSL